jgi:hypothetical protein
MLNLASFDKKIKVFLEYPIKNVKNDIKKHQQLQLVKNVKNQDNSTNQKIFFFSSKKIINQNYPPIKLSANI